MKRMSNFIGGPKPVLKDPRTNHVKMYIRQIKNGGRFSNMSKRDMNSSRFDPGAGNLKEFDLMPRKTFVFDISKGKMGEYSLQLNPRQRRDLLCEVSPPPAARPPAPAPPPPGAPCRRQCAP